MKIEFPPTIINASQAERGQRYLPVSQQRFIHERHSLEQWAVQLAARHHPHNQTYYVPAAVRAVVHAYERPGSVVCGFSALALYRLPFLVEGADTSLRAPTPRKLNASAVHPTVARLHAPHTETWTLTHRGVPIRVSRPLRATVQALQQIRRGEHSWQTEPIPGVSPEMVKAVQLVDCTRRHLGLQAEDIRASALRQINQRWLSRVLDLSSSTADSPKETELRLLLQPMVRNYGHTLAEQYPLIVGGKAITTFDFAIPELKIGIMFDGRHHWEYDQRQLDTSINLTSMLHGWTVPRAGSKTMKQCVEVVDKAIRQARGL